jgi:hypothetical protein
LKVQRDALWRKTTDGEIEDMIKERLFEHFSLWEGGDVSADELPSVIWENENVNGAFFCSNYRARRFCQQHTGWFDKALGYIHETYGDYGERWSDSDKCLVVAFIAATEHYIWQDCGVEPDEGNLSRKRMREIKRLVKNTPYSGEF